MNKVRLIVASIGSMLLLVAILIYLVYSTNENTDQDVEIFAVKSFALVDSASNHAFINGESVRFRIDLLASRPDIYLRMIVPPGVQFVESNLVRQSEDNAIHIRSEEQPLFEGDVFYFEPNEENSYVLTLIGQSEGRHKIHLEVYARRPGRPDDFLEIRSQHFCSASKISRSTKICEN